MNILNMSIRRRLLFLLLGVGVLSFMALGAVALRSMYGIRADIDAHANGAEQFDDITMLGIRYLG